MVFVELEFVCRTHKVMNMLAEPEADCIYHDAFLASSNQFIQADIAVKIAK